MLGGREEGARWITLGRCNAPTLPPHTKLRDCTPGYLLPPTRPPAAVTLPSMRITLTAGACGAVLDRPNPTAPAPVVTCTPCAVAYAYQPASILPTRTTPGAAVGPACSISAALPVAGVNTTGVTKVILPPATLFCPSLEALTKGDCVMGGGWTGGRRKKGKKGGMAKVSGVVDAEGVVKEVDRFLRDVFGGKGEQ